MYKTMFLGLLFILVSCGTCGSHGKIEVAETPVLYDNLGHYPIKDVQALHGTVTHCILKVKISKIIPEGNVVCAVITVDKDKHGKVESHIQRVAESHGEEGYWVFCDIGGQYLADINKPHTIKIYHMPKSEFDSLRGPNNSEHVVRDENRLTCFAASKSWSLYDVIQGVNPAK